MLRDREAALDATQETFVTVFRKADRFAGRSAFGTWLYRVAVNTCYDHARRSRRHLAEPLPEGNDPMDVAAGDAFGSVELRPDLEAALAALPAESGPQWSWPTSRAWGCRRSPRRSGSGLVRSSPGIPGTPALAEALGNLRDPSDTPSGEHHA